MEAVAAAPAPVLALGVPDRFVHHGKRELLLNEVGLTPEAVAARAIRCLTSGMLAGVPRV
jgi:deoxyxylulose-5-phosphate synthase